jgi:hypothetical protein
MFISISGLAIWTFALDASTAARGRPTMTLSKLLPLCLALALAACGPAKEAGGPSDVVEALYAPYLASEAGSALALDVYTPALKGEIDKATTYGNLLEAPVLDYDPIVNAQDFKISKLEVSELERSEDAAKVQARFDNMGTATEVTYSLQRIGEEWRVDDIAAGEQSLRANIAATLQPVANPTLMVAPVRVIYDTYRAATRPVPPLHVWAPLTPDLRARLKTAAGRNIKLLEVDPVLDGTENALGPVSYETASSAVIVRFTNAGAPGLLVYDMVLEGATAQIADIRSPGHWDLQQKLSEAGVE